MSPYLNTKLNMSKGSITHNNYDYVSVCSSQPTYPSQQFSLVLRQQPIQARVSSSNERDRKPIEPPPILQIKLNDESPQAAHFLQNPYFFVVVNLADPDSNEDILLDDQAVLSGQSVSSMYKLKDVTDEDGGFFCFGDLSAKIEGEYRLKFTLFEIVTTGAVHLMHVFSDVFRVYNAKNMPQLMDATFLSRSFSDQGVRIRIRKEHRVQVANTRKRKYSQVLPSTPKESATMQVKRSASMVPHSDVSRSIDCESSRSYAYNHWRTYANASLTASAPYSPPTQPYDVHHGSWAPSASATHMHTTYPPLNSHASVSYAPLLPSTATPFAPGTSTSTSSSASSTPSTVAVPAPTYSMDLPILSPPSSARSSMDQAPAPVMHAHGKMDPNLPLSPRPSFQLTRSPTMERIQLPPLHTLIPNVGMPATRRESSPQATLAASPAGASKKSQHGEVNAAVAMMQLSRQQQQQQQQQRQQWQLNDTLPSYHRPSTSSLLSKPYW